MIIFNVTIKVDWTIHDEWLDWMKAVHIPGMLATGHFYKYQMVRLLQVDEEDGPTYAVQYYCSSKDSYEQFLQTLSIHFRQKETAKWGTRFVVFDTVMEVVN